MSERVRFMRRLGQTYVDEMRAARFVSVEPSDDCQFGELLGRIGQDRVDDGVFRLFCHPVELSRVRSLVERIRRGRSES